MFAIPVGYQQSDPGTDRTVESANFNRESIALSKRSLLVKEYWRSMI
jgi:hypothetical protein